ncbi:MAG TPA: hypothetical protein PLA65_09430 [Spirochaetota bacterium]|nr:hypothetical protein [Spirochaetota bacterium]HOD14514.1 hypothetical protein [Spirochaetota bacterium]HPG51515.1 hypothetical protein [Spirochaetota bacterium]HPN12271.1 hypothetical protein [Spirochaetota bacterium]
MVQRTDKKPVKIIEEVYKKIIEHNAKANHEGIPHSDTFEKEIQSLMGIDKSEIEQIIKLLKDAHKIFTFEIIKDDPDNDIIRIDGYVETDLQTIRKLKNYFQKLLMDEYEKQYNKRLLVHQVVKDMYARPNFYKNTMIGQIGNKAIMLEEYENLIERNFTEYTENWKTNKLAELIALAGDLLVAPKPPVQDPPGNKRKPGGAPVSLRAVDSPQYQDYSSGKSTQSLDKVLQIYGVEFFFRINLRKYNFDLLRQIVESGEIDRRADLVLLKDMIQKVKENFDRDPGLAENSEKIYKLERIISRQMLYSH